MPDLRDAMQSASRKGQYPPDMLPVVASSLYGQVEPVLLEAFEHVASRPRDAFDALVLVGSPAQETFLQVTGKVSFGGDSDKVRRQLLSVIAMIGRALENGHVTVSSTSPFSGDEMVSAANPHFEAGSAALSASVGEAIERLKPLVMDLTRYLAAAHPKEYEMFTPLFASDIRPND